MTLLLFGHESRKVEAVLNVGARNWCRVTGDGAVNLAKANRASRFFRRPSLSTQGKVKNPSGEGVRAISSQVQAKAAKSTAAAATAAEAAEKTDDHETKVKEGTAKRNITRKKTADRDSGKYNSAYKKQGGHGKGEWKEMLDPSYVEALPIDENDPLYDVAEDSDRYVLTSGNEEADKRGYDPGTSKPVFGPLLTLQEFKFQLNECLREYFDSCDADEVIRTLGELGCQEFVVELPKKAISLAMDMGPRERELVSRLLTCLHPTPLSMEEMEVGFNVLLDGLDELSMDVPEAKVRVSVAFEVRTSRDAGTNIPFLFRSWWLRFWPVQWSTKCCRLRFCRTRTTVVRVTRSLRKL